ncbi:hypothetical protein PVAP13_1KG177931 [Panicum virgatum]|uniref:Uncharacterized protein n=1 Tax=Panicum virgatum TaxID=38727 RepID=A0A8T0XDU8_PANVG|nr:hypothetical protein PVAP13_1KG177931 [Panicum virgatum]
MLCADTAPQPDQARVQDGYARHCDESLAGAFQLCRVVETDCSAYMMRVRGGSPMSPMEQSDAWARTRDHIRTVLHAFGSRVQYDDDQASSRGSATTTQAPAVEQPIPMPHQASQPPPQYYPGAGYGPPTSYAQAGPWSHPSWNFVPNCGPPPQFAPQWGMPPQFAPQGPPVTPSPAYTTNYLNKHRVLPHSRRWPFFIYTTRRHG